MKRSIFLSIISIFASQWLLAQVPDNSVVGGQNLEQISANASSSVRVFDSRYEGIKGSPYLLDDWLAASLVTDNGQKIENVEIKLNLTEDGVFVKNENGGVLRLRSSAVDTIQLTENEQMFVSVENLLGQNQYEDSYYLELMERGEKVSLVARRYKSYMEANFKGAYSAGRTYDQYIDETDFFFLKNGQLSEVKTSIKSLAEGLGMDKKQLRNYINKYEINIREEEGIKKLVKYFNMGVE